MTLGEILRIGRESKGLSQREAGRAAGISSAYLSQVETGRIRDVAFTKVIRLCDLYGIDIRRAVAAQRQEWSG